MLSAAWSAVRLVLSVVKPFAVVYLLYRLARYYYYAHVWKGPRHRPVGPDVDQFSAIKDDVMRDQMHAFFRHLSEQYGDFLCCKIKTRLVYVIGNTRLYKEVQAANETFIRDEGFTRATGQIGPVLFAISGPTWKTHRKAISPAFAPVHLRNSLTIMLDLTDDLLRLMDSEIESGAADGWSRPLNVHALFSAITLDIFSRSFFSYDVHALATQDSAVARASDVLAGGITKRAIVPWWLWSLVVRDGCPQAVAYLTGVINQIIEQKLERLAEEGVDSISEKQKREMDLIDNLLFAAQKDKNGISTRELTSEMIGLFLAGHETTANTLTYAVQALCEHRRIAEELRRELEEVVGDNELTIDLIPQLKKLDCFLKEVTRFYPVVAFVPRTVAKDTVLDGYPIPKGSSLVLNHMRLHFHPDYWTDPQVFRPSRFETDRVVPGSYVPFGDGPHKCIGERLATLEAKVIIAKLVQRYNTKLASDQNFKLVYSITLGYKTGLYVQMHKL
ncbi:hypothetical protein RI367_003834 [Sorochytrium milnesiophthora]